MATVRMRAAEPVEAGRLSALALRSKAHWGYDARFIEACRTELTVRPERFDDDVIVVAEQDGAVVGFYLLSDDGGEAAELEFFYVDPAAIGRGLGGLLWRDAVASAQGRGHRRIIVHSDPNAEGFYRSMGARRIGEAPSGSIPGRSLPLLAFDIEETPNAARTSND